jgi:nicotinamide mononucleotide adenylyltransferase
MIISDGDWQNLVPSAVSEYIRKINGKNRLKIINNSDTKPTEH